MKRFKNFLFEGGGESGWAVEVAKTPLEKARPIAQTILKKWARDLDKELPDFDKNYELLYKRVKNSLGTLRRDMPVINADQIDSFVKTLATGKLDIFRPYTYGKPVEAKDLYSLLDGPGEFLELGLKDGSSKDDTIKASFKNTQVGLLKPIQEQIYFDKVMEMIGEHGAVKAGGFVTKLTMITSKENYIIDGHHRFAAVLLSDPKIQQRTLQVPLDINQLLKLTLAYGDAIGNQRNN